MQSQTPFTLTRDSRPAPRHVRAASVGAIPAAHGAATSSLRRVRRRVSVALLAASLAAAGVHAAPAEPRGVVALQASASTEVTRDWLSLTLATTREGADAQAVQSALRQALDAALAEARRAEQPGQIEVRTGQFSIGPRHTPRGEVQGWRGRAELIVQGRDMAGIAALAGSIRTLAIANVQQSLSRERRLEAEGELTGRAIANYRARAAEVARHFGHAGYVLREVSVSPAEGAGAPPPMAMRMQTAAASDESMPVQAGQETLVVNVQGTVQLEQAVAPTR